MATNSIFSFNNLQHPELSSLSLCKFSSISPYTFSSPKHTLKLKFPLFIFVKPHNTVITPVHTSIFCSLNHNISTKTVNFSEISENLPSGCSLKEEKFVEGKDGRGVSKNNKKSRNFGGRFNSGKRSENGDKDSFFKRDNKREERKMEENVGNVENFSNVHENFGKKLNFSEIRVQNGDKDSFFKRESKRVERKMEEDVGNVENFSNVNENFGKKLNFSEIRVQNGHGYSSRKVEEANSMSVGVNQRVGNGDFSKRVDRKMEENVGKVEKISNFSGNFRKKLNFSEIRKGEKANLMSVGVNQRVEREVIKGNGDFSKRVEKKMEENVGKVENFSSVNGNFWNKLNFSEFRKGEEANSMLIGVNQRVEREVIKGNGAFSERVERKMEENVGKVEKISNVNGNFRKKSNSSQIRGQNGHGFSSKKVEEPDSISDKRVERETIKVDSDCNNVKKKKEKLSKKSNPNSPEFQLRVGLDMCSKKGDVMGAISLYDSAVKEGVKMGQYHYTVLLYLCSSASMGVIRPAKSGSSTRRKLDDCDSDLDDDHDNHDDHGGDDDNDEIRVSDDVKKCALKKGFEIYERMSLEKVQMNEASLTSIARMAMAMGDGDMAFDMVNQMKSMGITPKLRSYTPALSVFTKNLETDKAFLVEKHMLENSVIPEEPELEALLRASVETGEHDRVYYILHKLRTTVRSVSGSVADLIEKWFRSKEASRVGKRVWDKEVIEKTMENLGGGWHGKGWFGKGKWSVSRTRIGVDGLCKCCGEKLALIDLDPEETERFAESVGSIAIKREKNANFQKFQRWLDYYGPFEAVVDAANVGLYSQRKFKASKVHAVVNGIRQMHPSRKWPLIVLHNRRVTGGKLDKPIDKDLVEKWRNADALYATPTGSNDDWYWLYAAIKFKCLLVTNDEMRDHTFQLLGNDFFPKWKERHQVRFSFSEVGPVFHFPPPCSVVIQESANGHWHIPIASEHQSEEERIWLCVTRPKSLTENKIQKVKEDSKESNRGA